MHIKIHVHIQSRQEYRPSLHLKPRPKGVSLKVAMRWRKAEDKTKIAYWSLGD